VRACVHACVVGNEKSRQSASSYYYYYYYYYFIIIIIVIISSTADGFYGIGLIHSSEFDVFLNVLRL